MTHTFRPISTVNVLYRSDDPWQLTNVYKDGKPANEPHSATRDQLLRVLKLRGRGMSVKL